MAVQASLPNAMEDATRPSSAWTNESTFADSAISVRSNMSKHVEDHDPNMATPEAASPSIADRLQHLAAAAWEHEQDGLLSQAQQEKIRKALGVIDACLEDRDEEDDKDTRPDPADDEEVAGQEELREIHERLAETVVQMRLRKQEQRHLHNLSMQKLEAVAHTCSKQEKQLKEMSQEAQNLLSENQKLMTENGWMQHHISQLETDATQKDVAVDAMTSAVAGLEGWISGSPGGSQTPARRRGRYVVRGRGRFRGRYWVDEPEDEIVQSVQETTIDPRELQDGVKAWVRGFRDVEEEVRRITPKKPTESIREDDPGTLDDLPSSEDDDSGEMETVSAAESTM